MIRDGQEGGALGGARRGRRSVISSFVPPAPGTSNEAQRFFTSEPRLTSELL